jgi:hypothetical protein
MISDRRRAIFGSGDFSRALRSLAEKQKFSIFKPLWK